MKIKRALISVSDKTGIEKMAGTLNKLGVEIISTGGTAKAIKALGIPVKEISDYTGFPEMMDGRVKTLHPKIHGGLLALRGNKEHQEQAKKHDIGMIDMVVVNLYPFEKTILKQDVTLDQAIENIDIGGPSMLRSAAKNYRSVAVVTDPADYDKIIDELEKNKGSISEQVLKDLAVKVFRRTSEYDGAIYSFLSKDQAPDLGGQMPETLTVTLKKIQSLRYGENPHQKAAFYKNTTLALKGICDAVQLQGKELSFNNLMDLEAALAVVNEFNDPAVSIIKHTNPCGAACAGDIKQAFLEALYCDKLSAFGSIMGFNRKVDTELAELIIKELDFFECLIAPGYDDGAKKAFSAKRNLRILELTGAIRNSGGYDIKTITGGALAQERDTGMITEKDLKVVTKKIPTKDQIRTMLFAWKIVKHVKSNAIVFAKNLVTIGIGAGQTSRVDSMMIAAKKAGDKAKGAVVASDAFFPKSDNIEVAQAAGIAAIIQPGGSIKDQEVIDACDRHGIAMVFTGMRHFKH